MARKKHEEEHENHERWLVSYADFITLLFAFFVVMYAVSSVNEGKYRVMSESIVSAFSRTQPLPVVSSDDSQQLQRPLAMARPRESAEVRREREQMTQIGRELVETLSPLIDEGKVRVMQTSRGVNVEISASVLFAPGEARLSGQHGEILKEVARVLQNDHHAIQVEGHTDNLPIHNASFPSNWELSAARASSVVRLFADNGIAESRLVAIGHSSTHPVASNDSADGRQRNRRVQLLVLSALPDPATEIPLGQKAR
jgi:chemotaxis protein MotB